MWKTILVATYIFNGNVAEDTYQITKDYPTLEECVQAGVTRSMRVKEIGKTLPKGGIESIDLDWTCANVQIDGTDI